MDRFEDVGYCVITLSDPGPIDEIRVRLLRELRELLGNLHVTLESYHEIIGDDDDRHIAIQSRLSELLREEKWHLPIFQRNLPLFVELMGPDLDVQSAPYLRIVRPAKIQDNIGYHRDTVYGGSPYELSVFVPFVELAAAGALSVEPGSHLKAERDIPFARTAMSDKDVMKGSLKHTLGFPYAPQVLDEGYPLNMLPVPLHIGQVLAFCLATLHGTILNESPTTRWTIDVRIKNAFAPVGARADHYRELARSRATKAAQRYLQANEGGEVSANETLTEDLPGTVGCLLCSSSDLSVTYRDPDVKMVTSDCKPWPYAAAVMLCNTCGHLQKLATQEFERQTKAAYADYDLYHLSDGREQLLYDDSQEPPKRRSDQILERLQMLVDFSMKGRMLDVGCGNGAMLEAFGTRFPKWSLFGFEQNSRYRTRVLGLPGVAGFYEKSIDRIHGQFDLITLIHVLEHVRNPALLLRQLYGLLSPQGLLLIEVPNAVENPFDMMVIDHYSHFSGQVLSRFVMNLGYEVLCHTTDWVDKEITLILSAGHRASSAEPKGPPPELMQRYRQNSDWLRRVTQEVTHHAGNSHFGLFGTAIAGTWLGAFLGDSVRFFVDEDPSMSGKCHLGKPVVHPDNLRPTDRVFLAFPYPIAARLYERVSKISRAEYVLPPAL